MASPSAALSRGKLVTIPRERIVDLPQYANYPDDLYGIVDYTTPGMVQVNLIYNCKHKRKSIACPVEHVRLMKRTEYRLLYDAAIARSRPRMGVKVDQSGLPMGGNGVIAYKTVPAGTQIAVSQYGCSRIQPAIGYDQHTLFMKGIPMTAFPYQACQGIFCNDGTIIYYRKKFWKLPKFLHLTNAKLVMPDNITNMPRVQTLCELRVYDEVFIEYEKGTTFSNQKLKTLWGPAPVFGNVERPALRAQFHKLYDHYYRTEDEEEEEEEEDEEEAEKTDVEDLIDPKRQKVETSPGLIMMTHLRTPMDDVLSKK